MRAMDIVYVGCIALAAYLAANFIAGDECVRRGGTYSMTAGCSLPAE